MTVTASTHNADKSLAARPALDIPTLLAPYEKAATLISRHYRRAIVVASIRYMTGRRFLTVDVLKPAWRRDMRQMTRAQYSSSRPGDDDMTVSRRANRSAISRAEHGATWDIVDSRYSVGDVWRSSYQ